MRSVSVMLRGGSARAQHDEELMAAIERLWSANFCVYGSRKMWRALLREGEEWSATHCCRALAFGLGNWMPNTDDIKLP